MIIGILAILKAGGAYVPLDPTYPKARLISILEDARPRIALVDNVGLSILKDAQLNQPCQKGKMELMLSTNVTTMYPVATFANIRITLLDHGDEAPIILIDINEPRLSPHMNPEVGGLTSRHLAYVTYTSGSSGIPKGVMIEHQGIVNHIRCRLEEYGLDSSSRVLQFTSLSFDVSVLEIFSALISGGALHLLLDDIRRDSGQLWKFLQDHSITHASLTPAILQSSKDFPKLKTPLQLTLAGEELPPSLLCTLQSVLLKGSSIVNEYGPTEATIIATSWKSPTNFNEYTVPIGRPIANKKIYILD
ncbi:hypothetical protein BGZ65_012602, partial [Modicella reniformis]